MGRIFLAGQFFGFLALVGMTAHGEEAARARARLVWSRQPGAEGCIDGQSLSEAVARRWGRDVFVDEPEAPIVVKGVARRTRGAWSVELALSRSDGTSLGSRRIVTRAPDCSALDDSLALALGLMLDLAEPAAKSTGTGPPAAPPDVSGPPITIPKETAAARAPWLVEPTIGVEGALGFVPGATFGGRLAVAAEPPGAWRIEAGGTVFENREIVSGRAGARFSLWTLDLAICPLSLRGQAVSAWTCIAQRAGRVHAEGEGFDANATPDETLLAAEARFGLTWSFAPPFAIHAGFGLDAPLVRFRFVYRDGRGDVLAVYRMSPIAGALALGIGALF